MTAASDAIEARLVQLDTDGDAYQVSILDRLDMLGLEGEFSWFGVTAHGPGYMVLEHPEAPNTTLYVNTELTDHVVIQVL